MKRRSTTVMTRIVVDGRSPRKKRSRLVGSLAILLSLAVAGVLQNVRILMMLSTGDENAYSYKDMPELIVRKRNKPIQSFQTFVVWTYPTVPPEDKDSEIGSDELFLCSYPPCGPHESERLNLRELTRDTKYSKFVQNHALYKLTLKQDYLHHIQSIAMLALVQKHPQKCVRMYGQRQLVCARNAVPYAAGYNPTSSKAKPPIVSTRKNINNSNINITFQALTFDSRIRIVKEGMVEDELHSLVAAQFYPYVSNFVDRDTGLAKDGIDANAHVLASGRYTGTGGMVQLPLPTITGVTFPSVQVGQSAVPNPWQDRHRMVVEQPIGAQDRTTLEFFQQHQMTSFLSLSFTLMWRNPEHQLNTTRTTVVLMDVAEGVVPKHIERNAKRLTHILNDGKHMARIEHTYDILETMATAKVVITSNMDMAFPAIVMGVPVIYVGNATELKMNGMQNVLSLYEPSSDHWNVTYDNVSSSLLPGAGVHRIDRARASFWNVLKHTSSFYSDTAFLYGMIPLQRLGTKLTTQQDWLFHFIWTTSPDTFTWREKRAIEHVFYHHPNARVLVHTNTLPTTDSALEIFIESGYDLVIEPYNLAEMIRTTIPHNKQRLANSFVEKLSEFITGSHWYSHETDIVRFLMLWLHGGVYLDTDMYLIKPLHKPSMANVIAYQGPSHSHASGAFMSFEPHHEMLKAALEWTLEHYDSKRNEWPVLGSALMTQLHQDVKYKDTFTVLDDASFYPIDWEFIDTCFTHRLADLDLANTYGVHLNMKITPHRKNTTKGTFCDTLLHEYCIFCDEIHTVPGTVRDDPTPTTIAPTEQKMTKESTSFLSSLFSWWSKRADTTLPEKKPKKVIRRTLPLVHMEFVPKQ